MVVGRSCAWLVVFGLIFGGTCGCSDELKQTEPVMVQSEHEHYHVHAADVEHGHEHQEGESGGHKHDHGHNHEPTTEPPGQNKLDQPGSEQNHED